MKKTGELKLMDVEIDLLEECRNLALENQQYLDKYNVRMFDIMGSVGTGKTSLIERLVCDLKDNYRVVVINGDLATNIDQERIRRHGVQAIQLNTGKTCHLDAGLVRSILEELNLEEVDLVIVENVGNLICPAGFPLGSHRRIAVISTPEGPYIALKHPHVFAEMDWIVINKTDLAPSLGVDLEKLVRDLQSVNPLARIYQTSCRDGTGIAELVRDLAGG